MATINSKGQRELGEADLLPLIQSYLGASLFKQSQRYEAIGECHAPFLDFSFDKVPLQTNLPTPQEKYVFASLFKDVEAKMILNLHLIRILQYKHTLLCLGVSQQGDGNQLQFIYLAIVFSSPTTATEWRTQYSFLTFIQIVEPYRSTHKVSMHESTTLLVTRPENLKVQARFTLEGFTTEKVRASGNEKFRQRRYIQALYQYEFGLGLAQSPENKRQRAILYANSSQCLFEMRLYWSAVLYADNAAIIDKKYAKGIYRKYTCYLELHQFSKAATALRAIHETCTPSQFQKAQKMFYRASIHSHGLFDWKDIFSGAPLNFSQYYSSNIKLVPETELFTNSIYVADKKINQFELLLFAKPMIYCSSEQDKFGQNYQSLISQIKSYSVLEEQFIGPFQELPSQNHFQGHSIKYSKNNCLVETNEIHAKCLRCLELEKVLTLKQGEKQSLGIWKELYKFKHDCLSNCTYIHIRGGLAVFAVKDIPEGDILTIDFLNWEINRRESIMLEKLGISCECAFCKWQWDMDWEGRSGQLLYSFYKHEVGECVDIGFEKLSLFYLWNLIFVKGYKEVELMKEYLKVLEKYPLWEGIINCLKYLRLRPRNDVFDYIKSMIKKFFEKYFKMSHSQAVQLLKMIL